MAGERPRLAAVRGQQIELLLFVLAAPRGEGEPAAVRRPARGAVAARTAGERPRLAARAVDDPDLGAVVVLGFVQHGVDEGDPFALRRDLRVAQPADAIEVVRLHAARDRFGLLAHLSPCAGRPPGGELRRSARWFTNS